MPGSGADKWGGRMGQQQAALEQLFPDMRPQAPQPPFHQQRQDSQHLPGQLPPQLTSTTTATATPVSNDILAGDIEQLNSHLHTARFCNSHKAAPPAPHTPAGLPPPDQAAASGPLSNGIAHTAGQPQPAQQRRVDANNFHERSRPKERNDRWTGSNGMYPPGGARLAQSNSPPMTPAYAQTHGMPVPAHLLQYHFPGPVFMPPNRDMRHPQHQQRQAQMHGQNPHQHQQPVAMPPWQPHPPRASSVEDLHRSASTEGSGQHTAAPAPQPQLQPPPPIAAPPASSSNQVAVDPDGPQDWEAPSRSTTPLLPTTHNTQLPIGTGPAALHGGPMAASALHGPACVDSPPAPRGIWGDGLHQQRLTNLASDLAHVRVTPAGVRTSVEAAAASNYGAIRKEAPPSSSSRSAGSTPHAGDTHRARGNFPFDNSGAVPNKRRQRLPHNASAHELGQSAAGSTGPEAPPKRDRSAKLSLDSLTSQAEATQRQRALAGFELKTDDFPALGGMRPSPSIPASPGLNEGSRTPHGKAWSETDALSPPVHKSPP